MEGAVLQQHAELEQILQQLFNHGLNSSAKLSLEQQLLAFKNHHDSWRLAKLFIQYSNNQFVLWFSISVFEDWIRMHRWENLPPQVKIEIREFFLQYLLATYKTHPPFVSKKLAKVYVDIGKVDWPLIFPDFLSNILRVIQNPQSSMVGVYLMTLVAEEFVSTKEDLPATRKGELKTLITAQLNTITTQLAQILDSLFEQFTKKIEPKVIGGEVKYISGFDGESVALVSAILECFLQFFSWIPLSDILTPEGIVLGTLFKYLQLNDNTAVQSLTCINEILSKNYVPRDFEDFLVIVFRQIFSLLDRLTTDEKNGVENILPAFTEKFTQFTALFVSNHFKRVENNHNFPIMEFLVLLYKYTFSQSTLEGFLACLDIWSTFLDYLLHQFHQTQERLGTLIVPLPQSTWSKYMDGLLSLLLELTKKMMWTENNQQLANLDNLREEGDEGETEVESFIKRSQSLISKIAELFPDKVLTNNLFPLFFQYMDKFSKVDQMIKSGFTQDESKQMSYVFKDFITILQLFGMMTEHFVYDFEGRFDVAKNLFTNLLSIGTYIQNFGLFAFGPDLANVTCELLGTLHSFNQWLVIYNSRTKDGSGIEEFGTILNQELCLVIPFIKSTHPPNVYTSACHLLHSISTTVNFPNLLHISAFGGLVSSLSSTVHTFPVSIQCELYTSVSFALLIPVQNRNIQPALLASIRTQYIEFIKSITKELIEVQQIQGFIDNKVFSSEEVSSKITRIFNILSSIVLSEKSESQQSKNILYDSLTDIFPMSLSLFRLYILFPKVLSSILDFFLSLFESVQQQLGVQFTQQTIGTFLELLAGAQLANVVRMKDKTGTAVVNNLIQILTHIIQTPGLVSDSLLPSIVSFSLDQVLPLTNEDSTEILTPLYTLLTQSLINHWKYFNTDNSPSNTSRISSALSGRATLILNAYHNSFQQRDIDIFRMNLGALEELNNTHRLYQRTIFTQTGFSFELLRTLLNTLIAKTHNLLREEIINIIYNIASVKFEVFYKQFMPLFMEHMTELPGLTPSQKTFLLTNFGNEMDHPSFNRNINNLINDICFYLGANQPPTVR